jgi:hypothetical protein
MDDDSICNIDLAIEVFKLLPKKKFGCCLKRFQLSSEFVFQSLIKNSVVTGLG